MGQEKKIREPKYHAVEIPEEGMTTHIYKQPLIEAIGCAALLGTGAVVFWIGFKLARLIPKQQNKS